MSPKSPLHAGLAAGAAVLLLTGVVVVVAVSDFRPQHHPAPAAAVAPTSASARRARLVQVGVLPPVGLKRSFDRSFRGSVSNTFGRTLEAVRT